MFLLQVLIKGDFADGFVAAVTLELIFLSVGAERVILHRLLVDASKAAQAALPGIAIRIGRLLLLWLWNDQGA